MKLSVSAIGDFGSCSLLIGRLLPLEMKAREQKKEPSLSIKYGGFQGWFPQACYLSCKRIEIMLNFCTFLQNLYFRQK